jgi:AcrR family transcriptional regulator
MQKSVKRENNPERKARGRPRSDKARSAILRAARQLIEEDGLPALTVEGIAARAGVGKPTIYRWWPDRHAVAMAALMESEPAAGAGATEQRSGPRRPSAIDLLQQQLQRMTDVFAQPVGRAVTRIIAASDRDSELSRAFRHHFILAGREQGRALLLQAIEQGEIRREADVEIALDMIYGVLFFRLFMAHAPLSGALPRQVIEAALRGLRP